MDQILPSYSAASYQTSRHVTIQDPAPNTNHAKIKPCNYDTIKNLFFINAGLVLFLSIFVLCDALISQFPYSSDKIFELLLLSAIMFLFVFTATAFGITICKTSH